VYYEFTFIAFLYSKQTTMKKSTTTLYRPINDKELFLVQELNYIGFPPRKPEQPFFYPVMNEAYATQITKDWNVKQYGIGYVTQFDVRKEFLAQFEVQNVGGHQHNELWVPAEQMDEFNANIVGKIKVISKFQ
jgi:hypothetical protein